MKGIFFLLLVSIIAFQKESTASPLLKELLGDDEAKLKLYQKACKGAIDGIQSYYEEKRKSIKFILSKNGDCKLGVIYKLIDALNGIIDELKGDFKGDAKAFVAKSATTLGKLSDNIKDLEEAIKTLSDQCRENLEKVPVVLIQIKTKCNKVRNEHVVVAEEYLKDNGLLKVVDDLLDSLNV